jgi:lipid II:glycine glycyltransferase (peptidoglycan interpeptide bridge formation enzyme)
MVNISNKNGAHDPGPESEWNAFLETQVEAGFMQSSWWAEFMLTRRWDHFGIAVSDDARIVGGARVMRYGPAPGTCYYYIPEGPVLPDRESDAEEVFQQVIGFIDERRKNENQTVSHLRLEPRWRELPSFVRGFQQAHDWMEPRDTLYCDLAVPECDLMARMKPKGRYNIGVARRYGVSVLEDVSRDGIEDFWAIYRETVARHELGGKKHDYFRALIPHLVSRGRGSLFFAEYEGERIATALVVFFGRRATYFFGGSRAIHRNVMAPYLLHFEIMRNAKKLGFQCYDLYGVAPLSKPNHAWANISAFKRKLGGQEISFVRSLDYIYDLQAYESYQRLRKARHSKKR